MNIFLYRRYFELANCKHGTIFASKKNYVQYMGYTFLLLTKSVLCSQFASFK